MDEYDSFFFGQNLLSQLNKWKRKGDTLFPKVIITCKSEVLNGDYKRKIVGENALLYQEI